MTSLGLGNYDSSEDEQEILSDKLAYNDTSKPILGPIQGPQIPSQSSFVENPLESNPSSPPLSTPPVRYPLHALTLPQFPNFNIPPSPPCSPDRSSISNAKVSQFLQIKRARPSTSSSNNNTNSTLIERKDQDGSIKGEMGIHYNTHLLTSTQSLNPSTWSILLSHVGLDGNKQWENSYVSTRYTKDPTLIVDTETTREEMNGFVGVNVPFWSAIAGDRGVEGLVRDISLYAEEEKSKRQDNARDRFVKGGTL